MWHSSGCELTVVLLCGLTLIGCGNQAADRPDEPNLLSFSNVPAAHQLSRGAGVSIAVIDWQFNLKGPRGETYIHPASMVSGEPIGELKPWHGEWMAELAHHVAPDARIVPIRARSLHQEDYVPYLLEGLRYAAEHGAIAVSSSMGPLLASAELRATIDALEERGTVFVNVHPELVVGTDGSERLCQNDECDPRILRTGVVSVPAHPAQPDLSREVYTWPYDLQAHWKDGWGYSNAPPTVLGTLALMKSANPRLGPSELRQIIRATTHDVDGFAVLDAAAAVRGALAHGVAAEPKAMPMRSLGSLSEPQPLYR